MISVSQVRCNFIDYRLILRLDKGPIILSDWYHNDYFSLVEGVVGTNPANIVRLKTFRSALVS